MRFPVLALCLALAACAAPARTAAPLSAAGVASAWDAARIEPILQRTQRLHLAADVSALSPGEQAAVRELLAAGERMHRLYMAQRHPQALAAQAYLDAHPELAGEHDLFRLNAGPIASTLDNTREAFLTVAPEAPARNVYPPGATRAALDAFSATHPERRDELLDDRAAV